MLEERISITSPMPEGKKDIISGFFREDNNCKVLVRCTAY